MGSLPETYISNLKCRAWQGKTTECSHRIKTRSSVSVSPCQSCLSLIPAGERVFTQILVFMCQSCLFLYPPDNLHRMTGTGKCWGVSGLRWDDDWLYYHFKWSVCWVLWFLSSLTCHASLPSSHRSPVLLKAVLSPSLCMTAAPPSSYNSRLLPSFPLHALNWGHTCLCACKGVYRYCHTSHHQMCLGCGRLLAVFSLLNQSAPSAWRAAPGQAHQREARCFSLCLQRCFWGKRAGLHHIQPSSRIGV